MNTLLELGQPVRELAAAAQGATAATAAPAIAPLGAGPDLARYLLVCGGMIALLLGCAYLLRRLVRGAQSARAARRSLQMLDLLPLGGKQRLAVVRCYDRTFVLGLGDKEVALVAELDPELDRAPARSTPTTAAAGPLRTRFADLISVLQKPRASGAAQPAAQASAQSSPREEPAVLQPSARVRRAERGVLA
jgi:flagellar biogenesis protein FliO